jgi:hypothetical protein
MKKSALTTIAIIAALAQPAFALSETDLQTIAACRAQGNDKEQPPIVCLQWDTYLKAHHMRCLYSDNG